jgi:hypothetical protein
MPNLTICAFVEPAAAEPIQACEQACRRLGRNLAFGLGGVFHSHAIGDA